MHPRKSFSLLVVVALGCVLALAFIMRNHAGGGRDSRLADIERTRSLASTVARQESSPIVQAISKATRVDPADYLRKKVDKEERAARNSGELLSVSIWAPGLGTQRGWQDFLLRASTNSTHFVGWKLSEDELLTGYVRPDEVGIWQSELCTITNPVPWAERRLFALAGEHADCLLPDGSHVGVGQLTNWLNESIAEGWCVGVSLVQGDTSVLVGSRKGVGMGTPSGGRALVAPHPTN